MSIVPEYKLRPSLLNSQAWPPIDEEKSLSGSTNEEVQPSNPTDEEVQLSNERAKERANERAKKMLDRVWVMKRLSSHMVNLGAPAENQCKISDYVSKESLMGDGESRVDFLLVFESDEGTTDKSPHATKNADRRKFFEENLKQTGVDVEHVKMEEAGKVMIFVKLHASWEVLCQMAEKLKFRMPLWMHDVPPTRNHTVLSKFFDYIWKCGCYRQETVSRKRSIFGDEKLLITWQFNQDNIDRYAVTHKDKFFSATQRIEIVWEILQNTLNDPHNEKSRGIEHLLEKHVYSTAFPMHDPVLEIQEDENHKRQTTRQKLIAQWATWSAFYKPQPLDRIRKYLGEKIAFYFAFMDFYTKMLIFPSILGIIVFIYGLCFDLDDGEVEAVCDHHSGPGSYYFCPVCKPPNCEMWLISHEGCEKYLWDYRLDNQATMVMSILTMFWAIIFLKYWKRREATLAAEWNTFEVEENDSTLRPDFVKKAPTVRKNFITSELEPHMPFHQRALRMAVSVLITLIIVCLDAVCLIVLLLCRIFLYGAFLHSDSKFLAQKSVDYARWVIHGLLFVMITIYHIIYHRIAHKLTSIECPRTHNAFINSLLWKLFIFEFLNEFVIILYPAFLKGKTVNTPLDMTTFLDEICDGACMVEVTELVAVLLLLRLFIGNFFEIGIPLMRNLLVRMRLKKMAANENRPQWFKEYHLKETELDGVYEEYMEMMVQFGFITLFIPAFPLGALICFINNILEIRIDAIKLLRTRRRPVPIRVSGIAIWNKFLDIILKMAVICNAALLAFTSDIIPRLYYSYELSPDGSLVGYMEWSLSSINLDDWDEMEHEAHEKNITKCHYGDFREPEPPYKLTIYFWETMVLRLGVFIIYISFFFIVMWIVNSLVDNVPPDVLNAYKRRKVIVNKALEAEGALNKSNWYQQKRYANKEKTLKMLHQGNSFDSFP